MITITAETPAETRAACALLTGLPPGFAARVFCGGHLEAERGPEGIRTMPAAPGTDRPWPDEPELR